MAVDKKRLLYKSIVNDLRVITFLLNKIYPSNFKKIGNTFVQSKT